MATLTTKINDKGFDKAVEAFKRLGQMSIKVGIQADADGVKYEKGKKGKKGASVLDVAIFNEYGTDKIPSRPFIRQCYALNSETALQLLEKAAIAVGKGADPIIALSRVGSWYQDRMKHTLLNYPWVVNAPSTIKRKKSSKPLVNTKQLLDSIRYEVIDE